MKKVNGIGGVFFKSKDVSQLYEWYKTQLDFPVTDWGASMVWSDVNQQNQQPCYTIWCLFKDDTTYFAPGTSPFMINYRVHNLKDLIDTLRSSGVTIAGDINEYDYGKFAWIVDPEGRKIELWEPVDSGFGPPGQPWTGKVLGLAGICLKSGDPSGIKEWYKKHLDIDGSFSIIDPLSKTLVRTTWSVAGDDDPIFDGTEKPYVFAYRVRSKDAGTFFDTEGNKILLET